MIWCQQHTYFEFLQLIQQALSKIIDIKLIYFNQTLLLVTVHMAQRLQTWKFGLYVEFKFQLRSISYKYSQEDMNSSLSASISQVLIAGQTLALVGKQSKRREILNFEPVWRSQKSKQPHLLWGGVCRAILYGRIFTVNIHTRIIPTPRICFYFHHTFQADVFISFRRVNVVV